MRIQTQNGKPDLHLAFNIIYKKCYLKEHSINSTYFNLSFQFLALQDYSCLKSNLWLLSLCYQPHVSFWKTEIRASQLLPSLPPSKTSVCAPCRIYIRINMHTHTHTYTDTLIHKTYRIPKLAMPYQLAILIP